MKPYRYVGILAFFALCSQASATSLLPTPNVNTQGQDQVQGQTQGQAQSAIANSAAGAIAGSAAISGSNSTSGSAAVNTTSVRTGANTLSAGASNSAASTGASTSSNGAQTVNFNYPANTTSQVSGTTELRTVAPVYAPDMVTTATCMIGASGGATGLGWGFALGTGIEDKGCTRRENARLLKNLGKGEAAVKIMCNDPEVAAALGADCAVAAQQPAK
jgi:hypothetical protein